MKNKKMTLILLLLMLPFATGCNRLKGDKGETGAPGSAGPNGETGQFFEFTGTMPASGVISIGQLSTDSLVAVFMSTEAPPAINWFPYDSYTVDYQAGTVTVNPFLPSWTYKIIVIHNAGAQSTSLL